MVSNSKQKGEWEVCTYEISAPGIYTVSKRDKIDLEALVKENKAIEDATHARSLWKRLLTPSSSRPRPSASGGGKGGGKGTSDGQSCKSRRLARLSSYLVSESFAHKGILEEEPISSDSDAMEAIGEWAQAADTEQEREKASSSSAGPRTARACNWGIFNIAEIWSI